MKYLTRKPMEVPSCLECGKEMYGGRSDKKFCSLGCKNKYHNQHVSDNTRYREKVVTHLNVNYRILSALIRQGVSSIGLNELETLGFRVSLITGCSRYRNHSVMHCYDICYCQSDSRIFKLCKTGIDSVTF